MTRYPTDLARNDPAGALRWVELYRETFGELPGEDAFAVLLQLQDEPSQLERELAERFPSEAK